MSIIKKSVFIFIFLILICSICFVLAQENKIAETKKAVIDEFDKPVDQSNALNKFFTLIGFGTTIRQVILNSILFGIVVFFMYNLLMITSLFDQDWVIKTITFSLAVILLLSRANTFINNLLTNIFVYLGTAGAIIQIVISFLVFLGLIFLGPWARIFVEKRKAQHRILEAMQAGERVGQAGRVGEALEE